MPKILIVFGTRPEVIKLYPVIRALKGYEQAEVKICVTAQHREMLDQFLNFFHLDPDYDLNIMKKGQTPSNVASEIFAKLEPVLQQERPEYVVVQGDTTTVAATAMCAFYCKVKVAHVEAGLRTFNKWLPFPEEINRKVAGVIADLHFAPTRKAKENLLKEGIDSSRIFVTGNPVVDTLMSITRVKDEFKWDGFEDLISSMDGKRLVLVTAHRRENFGPPLLNICTALKTLSEMYRDHLLIVYPVHLNPNVWEPVHDILKGRENIRLIPPVDYFLLVNLMLKSYLILTDSGGIQEEAPTLGKPVLLLREVTERPEAVEAGAVKVVGTDKDRILEHAIRLIEDPEEYNKMAGSINPYGDGRAGERIAKILMGEEIEEWEPERISERE